ncbi:MAG TPA: hypothetical protein VGY98_00780 [Verrucomicrobiae bacterium]|nr:hypothetical protein [Verrucomicrobiae bacterium]
MKKKPVIDEGAGFAGVKEMIEMVYFGGQKRGLAAAWQAACSNHAAQL